MPIDPRTTTLLVQHSTDWMWVVDTTGRHVFSNRAIESILGYAHDEILAVPDFIALVHPDDRPRIFALMERSTAARSGWSRETFRWRHRNGSFRWLESHGSPLFAPDGALMGFCGVDRDVTAHIEQEQLVTDSERRFRMTFERAGVGITHVSPDGAWLRVNEPFCRFIGYSQDELLTMEVRHLTHPDDLPADFAQLDRLLAGEIESYSIEKRYIRKGGDAVWGASTRSLVRDDAGNPEYLIDVVRDITDRKEAEAAQRQSERDYRMLFENSHDVALVVERATGTILQANRRAGEVYGYAPEALIGKSMRELSTDFDRVRGEIDGVIRGSTSDARFETVHRRRDGSLIELEVMIAPTTYQGRDAMLNTARDVTEERRLMRVVAASEQRFRAIVEHGYDMIAVSDEDGTIRFVTGSLAATLGLSSEEIEGTKLGTRVHPEDRQRVLETFASLLGAPGVPRAVTCRMRRADAQWRWCEGVGINMRSVEGVEGIVMIARDVTHRLDLESRLEQARRVESLGRVAATVAHEFNNLLMGILPVSEFLRRKHGAAADIARVADQLRDAVKRGGVITADILRFANPSRPVRVRVDLAAMLPRLCDELRPLLDPKITLALNAPDSIAVKGDADQLHQLVANLVLNARDAMPDGGVVSITVANVRDDGESAVDIVVRDSGPGVPPDIGARIFEPLFTTRRKGTGLGLALCQQIAAAHGGSITLESPPEGGAAFRVRLPA